MKQPPVNTSERFGDDHVNLSDPFDLLRNYSGIYWELLRDDSGEIREIPNFPRDYRERIRGKLGDYQQLHYGHYPKEVLADKIYCNRANRLWLKEKNIRLAAKPVGRPSKEALSNQVSLVSVTQLKESLDKQK